MTKQLQPFLADTLWFGMTSRISFNKLRNYARHRVKQGFNAVQVVVGIPPEVGPLNINAHGTDGPAWDLDGNFNETYLQECEVRVNMLNEEGMMVIIYGAWGHQINWLGVPKMKEWWDVILKRFEKYDVIFCLCGESNIWIDQSATLLPDKTTSDFKTRNKLKKLLNYFPFNRFRSTQILNGINYLINISQQKVKSETLEERKINWSVIAEYVSEKTKFPLLIHTVHTESSLEAINNSNILSAITTQTGHDQMTRNRHWKDPIKYLQENPKQKFINLEPWYEGILNNFYYKDQIFSYWATMLAGAYAYCYGAHGIWNCGDGIFLSQWGKQTFNEAMTLETPKLIGLSNRFFFDSGAIDFPLVEVDVKKDVLISIKRKNVDGKFIQFFPEYDGKHLERKVIIFCPLTGKIIEKPTTSGPLIILGK